jgi:F0F1-type ATP synthase assembly protein I
MFWKLSTLALLLWAVGMYFSVTLGGFLHVVPAAVFVCFVVRRMAKKPNTEFGRWRAPPVRVERR